MDWTRRDGYPTWESEEGHELTVNRRPRSGGYVVAYKRWHEGLYKPVEGPYEDRDAAAAVAFDVVATGEVDRYFRETDGIGARVRAQFAPLLDRLPGD